jgi:hypothetical protein
MVLRDDTAVIHADSVKEFAPGFFEGKARSEVN